jgi:predicted nucleotidyltransferase
VGDGAAWQQVRHVAAGLGEALAANLVGVYLHGSLALGCFNPQRSDLDILAVTHGPISLDDRVAVARFLLAVSGRPYPIEISILTWAQLHPWRHPAPYEFHFSEDWRADIAHALVTAAWREWQAPAAGDPDLAAHITVMRARGVRLTGPPIEDVFPAVPREDHLDSLAADVLDERFGLNSHMTSPVYSILNACRTWAYLRTGAVLSKAEGGAWALGELPADLRSVVAAALEVYATRGYPDELPAVGVTAFAVYMRPVLRDSGLQ